MNKDLTEIVFIIDGSSSMAHLTSDTVGGFNSFIEDQKTKEGEAKVTTVIFDDKYEILHNGINIQDIQPLTEKDIMARGSTAMLDAIGKTINTVGERLAKTEEEDRPAHVVIVITTDGQENASKEFDKAQIKEMIERQQNTYSWTFVFMEVNMDAVAEGTSIGINAMHTHTHSYNSAGVTSVYASVSKGVTGLRGATGDMATMEKKLNNCNKCPYINLTEEQQRQVGDKYDHICTKLGKRVRHFNRHPISPPLQDCPLNN